MAKMLAIVKMQGGAPDLTLLPQVGYVLAGVWPDWDAPAWGAYLFSGPVADLQKLGNLDQVYAIVTIAGSGRFYANLGLDAPLPAVTRTRLNEWIAAEGGGIIKPLAAEQNCRQTANGLLLAMNEYFSIHKLEVQDLDP